METIVLDRRLEPPMQLDDVRAMGAQAGWCMSQHRVRHVTSLLSVDGRRLLCSFAAPDAEAVRSVLRQLGFAFAAVWPATIHMAPNLASTAGLAEPSIVLVERQFSSAVDLAALQAIEDRGAACLEQHRVHPLRSYLAVDRTRMLSVYAAPDAESVRRAHRDAGVPPGDAWPVRVYDTPE